MAESGRLFRNNTMTAEREGQGMHPIFTCFNCGEKPARLYGYLGIDGWFCNRLCATTYRDRDRDW